MLEKIIESNTSSRCLENQDVGTFVFKNLSWLEDQRGWKIYAACIMPNHMHIVLRNVEGRNHLLVEDIAQFKGFTARVCNRLLNRKGHFWARESFDHWCRNHEKTDAVMRYTIQNPVKAGLVEDWSDWPWSRIDEEMLAFG
jgi:REP element-mobilizing transposase RayT